MTLLVVNVCAAAISTENNVIDAKMVTLTTQSVCVSIFSTVEMSNKFWNKNRKFDEQIAIVIYKEHCQRSVKNNPANVYVKKDSEDRDAISVYQDITIIPIVNPATVRYWVVFQRFVIYPENVLVWQVLLENNAHNVARVIMRIPNVCVSFTVRQELVYVVNAIHNFQLVTVASMAQSASHVTAMGNVCARIISMGKIAINAKKDFTTIHHAKNVIAIQLVLLLNLPVVVLCLLGNCVNAKNA